MNSSPIPLQPFGLRSHQPLDFRRLWHLFSITAWTSHRVPLSIFGSRLIDRASPPPRARRRKWKGWQQQQREAGRR